MAVTQKFRKLLDKSIKVMIQETRDGCNDCREVDVCCKHQIKFTDLVLHPHKYITIESVKGKLRVTMNSELMN